MGWMDSRKSDVKIPPEFVPEWYDASNCKGRTLEDLDGVDFLQETVVWLPDVRLKSYDKYKYRTPGKPARLGDYAPWIQPKVELVAVNVHANMKQWVQCVNPPTGNMFFFPLQDLVLPTTEDINTKRRRARATIVDAAQTKHGEVPRCEKLTIGVLRDLMEKDGGVYSKMKAVKALYACYGDSELSLEYLRSKEDVAKGMTAANNEGVAKRTSPFGSWMGGSPRAAAAPSPPPPPNTTYKVGDRVRARWQGLGLYYPGKIMGVTVDRFNSLELYHIHYDDQMEEHDVETEFIQPMNRSDRW